MLQSLYLWEQRSPLLPFSSDGQKRLWKSLGPPCPIHSCIAYCNRKKIWVNNEQHEEKKYMGNGWRSVEGCVIYRLCFAIPELPECQGWQRAEVFVLTECVNSNTRTRLQKQRLSTVLTVSRPAPLDYKLSLHHPQFWLDRGKHLRVSSDNC